MFVTFIRNQLQLFVKEHFKTRPALSIIRVGNLRHACHTWHAKQFPLARRSSMFCISILLWFTRSVVHLELCKNTDIFGTLNDLELSIDPHLPKRCRPLVYHLAFNMAKQHQKISLANETLKNHLLWRAYTASEISCEFLFRCKAQFCCLNWYSQEKTN